jgi:hypothetical protein
MMQNKKIPMNQFENKEDGEAFKTAIEEAITAKDYTAFKAAHTKYNLDFDLSEEDFATMLTRKADAETRRSDHEALREQSQTVIENGDYATWAELNKDTPMGEVITTEAKFEQLQEMHTYKEKAKTIAEELNLP